MELHSIVAAAEAAGGGGGGEKEQREGVARFVNRIIIFHGIHSENSYTRTTDFRHTPNKAPHTYCRACQTKTDFSNISVE
jgi:hypothetical protein